MGGMAYVDVPVFQRGRSARVELAELSASQGDYELGVEMHCLLGWCLLSQPKHIRVSISFRPS